MVRNLAVSALVAGTWTQRLSPLSLNCTTAPSSLLFACLRIDIMAEAKKKDSRLERAGVSGYNKPKRTPDHPKKSHVVVAKEGDTIKTIRFGEQGASTAGKPKAGESDKMKKKRASFKARHGKNIAKGKMSAAYWADKAKW
tara:strand:+ start:263 stop:685 length:423 start_codon:yes stop_codon:yes gene_type:complete